MLILVYKNAHLLILVIKIVVDLLTSIFQIMIFLLYFVILQTLKLISMEDLYI
jgi:hypothetical protein